MVDEEPLIFEAEPTIYFSLYNNYPYYDSLAKPEKVEAFYVNYSSHFRMFQGRSKPVRMPSYKAMVGYQRSVELEDGYFSIALESGHYSNGQSGCAWADTSIDGTLDCRRLAQALGENEDLSKRLNRINGNFSTNLSRIRLQYVSPKKRRNQAYFQRFDLDYTYNHEALFLIFKYNGSADNDVKVIGRHQVGFSYEYNRNTDLNFSYAFKLATKRLIGQHNSIEPWRFETSVSVFPEDWITAFYLEYIYGHDDYNFRIVDAGQQVSIGLRWDLFQAKEFR